MAGCLSPKPPVKPCGLEDAEFAEDTRPVNAQWLPAYHVTFGVRRLLVSSTNLGEHFVELRPLDSWTLDRAGRVEPLRVLHLWKWIGATGSGVSFFMNRFRKLMRLTSWCFYLLGARGQLSDDRRYQSDAQAPQYLDLSS